MGDVEWVNLQNPLGDVYLSACLLRTKTIQKRVFKFIRLQ